MFRIKKALLIVALIFLIYSVLFPIFAFNYSKLSSISLITLYTIPEETKKPHNIISRHLFSFLALREIKTRQLSDELTQSLIATTVVSKETLLYSEGSYKKLVNLIHYFKNKKESFYYGSPCSETQKALFLISSGQSSFTNDFLYLKTIKLEVFLLNNAERNKSNPTSNQIYCQLSVNEYLKDEGIKSIFNNLDIDEIIDDLLSG